MGLLLILGSFHYLSKLQHNMLHALQQVVVMLGLTLSVVPLGVRTLTIVPLPNVRDDCRYIDILGQ